MWHFFKCSRWRYSTRRQLFRMYNFELWAFFVSIGIIIFRSKKRWDKMSVKRPFFFHCRMELNIQLPYTIRHFLASTAPLFLSFLLTFMYLNEQQLKKWRTVFFRLVFWLKNLFYGQTFFSIKKIRNLVKLDNVLKTISGSATDFR